MRVVEFTEAEAKRLRSVLKYHINACEQIIKDNKTSPDYIPSLQNEIDMVRQIREKLEPIKRKRPPVDRLRLDR